MTGLAKACVQSVAKIRCSALFTYPNVEYFLTITFAKLSIIIVAHLEIKVGRKNVRYI